jgi:hypothetical protein
MAAKTVYAKQADEICFADSVRPETRRLSTTLAPYVTGRHSDEFADKI